MGLKVQCVFELCWHINTPWPPQTKDSSTMIDGVECDGLSRCTTHISRHYLYKNLTPFVIPSFLMMEGFA